MWGKFSLLNNYYKDEFGVVHQMHREPFTYDKTYVQQRYGEIDDLVMQMSHLRLGFVLGSMPHAPKKVLDVGYGSGTFLKLCDSFGMQTHGCDLFPDYLPTCSQFVQDPCDASYDLITFYDSLEHFEDVSFVKHLKCEHVVISVPWCHAPEDDTWFLNWKHLRPNEHLHHFNDASLKNFMQHCGFTCVTSSNLEDVIRKSAPGAPNILSAVFRRM